MQKLSRSEPTDAKDTANRTAFGRRTLSLPRPVDDAIMRITELLKPMQSNGLRVPSSDLGYESISTEFPNTLWSYYGHGNELEPPTLSDDFLRGYDWINPLLDSSIE